MTLRQKEGIKPDSREETPNRPPPLRGEVILSIWGSDEDYPDNNVPVEAQRTDRDSAEVATARRQLTIH